MRFSDLPTNEAVQPRAWYENLITSVSNLGTAYLTFEQQRQLNEINLQRAALNQRPLSAAEYTAGFNVGLGSSTQNTLLIAVGIIGGVYLLSQMGGRRR